MNGVRRLLGAATTLSPQQQPQDTLPVSPVQTVPLNFASKAVAPNWPPSSPFDSPPSPYSSSPPQSESSPKPTTASLLISKKDRTKPALPATNGSSNPDNIPQSPYSTPSRPVPSALSSRTQAKYATPSPTRSQTMPNSPASPSTSRFSARKSVNTDPGGKRNSGNLNTRDELLMSLMASEAVIDSREFDVLSAEEVEELKKEHQVLTSRLEAMNKKLALETKIRDAALNLSKVNASHKKVSKQTSDQLDAANKRVESAQKELWKVSDRVNEVYRRLMEHRAGVLSVSVRNLEKKMNASGAHEDSGYDSSNRSTLMSPTSSVTGLSSGSKARFDGAHLFAGHADTLVPRPKLSAEAAMAELTKLEEKLKEAKDQLSVASKKQAEMTREVSLTRLEKQEVETMMGMDLQAAEETIAALEKEIPRLEELNAEVQKLRQEKASWERERSEADRGKQAGADKVLESSKRQLEEKDAQIQQLRDDWEAEREEWERERQQLEDDRLDDIARLQDEMDRMRDEGQQASQENNEELSAGLSVLQAMIKQHGIVLFSRDSTLQGLLNAIGMHIETVHAKLETHSRAEGEWDATRRKLEDDVRTGFDKREALARELEEARRERDAMSRDTLTHLRTPSVPVNSLPSDDGDLNVARITALFQPLWQVLPSPEHRAAKLSGGNNTRAFRTGSAGSPAGGPNGTVTSLSELDVRTLKSMYDTRQVNGATPPSPKPGSAPFSFEAFAQRVQALINDDKALIERLIRFAQAHELLKKNAERAQKLAQDGNAAMETYQKQVRMLEERDMSLNVKQAAMQEELNLLHDTIERLTGEKIELERLAAEQAETCEQLTEANNTLSAKTLTLAEEAAMAPEMVRKQFEAQLSETKKALELAQDELDAMRTSEQSQRIALLDELNSMQTENGNLRAQLRAAKK